MISNDKRKEIINKIKKAYNEKETFEDYSIVKALGFDPAKWTDSADDSIYWERLIELIEPKCEKFFDNEEAMTTTQKCALKYLDKEIEAFATLMECGDTDNAYERIKRIFDLQKDILLEKDQ